MSDLDAYTGKVETLKNVDEYLKIGQEYECSDIHLAVGAQPHWRRFGTLQPIWENATHLNAENTEQLAKTLLTKTQWDIFEEEGDIDYAYAPDFGRFRASVVKQRLGIDMAFRIIDSKVRTLEELGLPDVIRTLTKYQSGLILVTGSVGSGKSTTLAALVDEVNKTRKDHIITLEEPIEFVFDSEKCHINQREIISHTKSFASALRASLREDPDIIMVGEMRDLETISLAITAAETGHLVMGTLHTGSAPRTLDRILDVFPTDQREQVRIMLGESLRGIISQQLVPRLDNQGRVMAMEILLNTPAVSNTIRESKTFMLPGIIQTGKALGMISMDDSLKELYDTGLISQDECLLRSENKTQMKKHFES